MACAVHPCPAKVVQFFPPKRKIVIEASLILVTGKSSAGKKSAAVRKLITIGWIPSSENSFYSIEREWEMKGGEKSEENCKELNYLLSFLDKKDVGMKCWLKNSVGNLLPLFKQRRKGYFRILFIA
jgi:hypothetical protein